MGLKDRLLADLAGSAAVKTTRTEIDHDRFVLVPDRDGVLRRPCFFCNSEVEFPRPTAPPTPES